MGLKSKISWVTTGLALGLLKRSLGKRISGAATVFLHPVRSNTAVVFNRVDFIMEQCAGKKVLHAGFTDHPFTRERIGDGSLLHLKLRQKAAAIYGADLETAAIALYRQLTADDNVVNCDITHSYPDTLKEFAPDIILLGEVIEHLKRPHIAAEVLYNSFPDGTRVLVTVPNYLALDNISAALHRTESVHPDHYWYFSPYTLQRVFDETKFTLEQLHFGMYYQPGKSINAVMQQYPFCGDCIMAVFLINKKAE